MSHDQSQPTRITRSNSLNDTTQNLNLKSLLNDLKTDIISKLDDVNNNITKLTTRIECLENSLSSIKAVQDIQQTELDSIKHTLLLTTDNINGLQQQVLDEFEERQRRANSLIIFGLPEQSSGTVEQRKVKDEESLLAVTEVLQMKDVVLTSCSRIGKIEDGKTRPLRVNVKSTSDKFQLISRSKQLKNSSFSRVFIKPDLTPSQQLTDRRLRQELRERRSRNEDVILYRGKVIKKTDIGKIFHH